MPRVDALPDGWADRVIGDDPYSGGGAGQRSRPAPAPATDAQSEKVFMERVRQLAVANGWLVYHPYDSRRSEPGYPDLTLVHPRRGVVWAELKVRGGRVTAEQDAWLSVLRQAGQRAYLWRPSDWADIEAVLGG